MTDIPRCGDVVVHKPSDEEWVVAWAEGNDLAWCGWPNGMVRVSDCEIVKKASDAEHLALVREVCNCGDSRATRCDRLYGGEGNTIFIPKQTGD